MDAYNPDRIPLNEADITPEKAEELRTMKDRLMEAFGDPEIRKRVEGDFIHTFTQLGLDGAAAQELCDEVIAALSGEGRLDAIEAKMLARFNGIHIDDGSGTKNLVDILHEKLKGRAELIASQVRPYFKDIKGKVFDYGTGDGQVAQRLHDDPELHLDIEGGDVRDYKAAGVTIPVRIFSNKHVDSADGGYEAVLMTNVAHHEKNNEIILEELSRIAAKRLVVIETVPTGEDEEEIEKDAERTFANDYLYNRLFHDADVPVPGTYETPKGWEDRFKAHGWRVVESRDLGYDQPTIRDIHHLLIFEK